MRGTPPSKIAVDWASRPRIRTGEDARAYIREVGHAELDLLAYGNSPNTATPLVVPT
jgi:hypothetical protein